MIFPLINTWEIVLLVRSGLIMSRLSADKGVWLKNFIVICDVFVFICRWESL